MKNSIRFRRGRRKINKNFELQLTSMLDMLVIILVFLLKSYQTSVNEFSTVKGIQLPISRSETAPPDSHHIIITPEAITFENERIVDFVQTADSLSGEAKYTIRKEDIDEEGRRIRPLFDAFIKAREKSELLRAKSKARDADGKPLPFDGVLAIQADKRVSYDVLRRVMYSAGGAGYKVFRFLAMKRET